MTNHKEVNHKFLLGQYAMKSPKYFELNSKKKKKTI